MILCDTTLIIDVLNEVEEAIHFVQSQKPEALLISVVTEWEVLQGARNKKEYKAFQKALKCYNIIELDSAISSHAGILLKTYQLSQALAIPDALIAATSVKYQIPLKTANIKDFRYIKGIALVS